MFNLIVLKLSMTCNPNCTIQSHGDSALCLHVQGLKQSLREQQLSSRSGFSTTKPVGSSSVHTWCAKFNQHSILINGSWMWALLAKHAKAPNTQPYVYACLLVPARAVTTLLLDLSCKSLYAPFIFPAIWQCGNSLLSAISMCNAQCHTNFISEQHSGCNFLWAEFQLSFSQAAAATSILYCTSDWTQTHKIDCHHCLAACRQSLRLWWRETSWGSSAGEDRLLSHLMWYFYHDHAVVELQRYYCHGYAVIELQRWFCESSICLYGTL